MNREYKPIAYELVKLSYSARNYGIEKIIKEKSDFSYILKLLERAWSTHNKTYSEVLHNAILEHTNEPELQKILEIGILGIIEGRNPAMLQLHLAVHFIGEEFISYEEKPSKELMCIVNNHGIVQSAYTQDPFQEIESITSLILGFDKITSSTSRPKQCKEFNSRVNSSFTKVFLQMIDAGNDPDWTIVPVMESYYQQSLQYHQTDSSDFSKDILQRHYQILLEKSDEWRKYLKR
jgi:hypothetical protein